MDRVYIGTVVPLSTYYIKGFAAEAGFQRFSGILYDVDSTTGDYLVSFSGDNSSGDGFSAGTALFKTDGTTKFSLTNSHNDLKFSGNGRISSRFVDGPSGFTNAEVLDLNGSLVFDKGTSTDSIQSSLIDSSNNNYYLVGVSNPAGGVLGNATEITKLNSSGTQQWKKTFYKNLINASYQGYNATIDSSANIYLPNAQGLTKIDTNGSVIWNISVVGAATTPAKVSVDSSGNVYTYWQNFTITKHNSSGTLQWQKVVSSIGTINTISPMSDGTVYLGFYNYNSPTGANILKLNTDGTINFARYFQSSAYFNVSGYANVYKTTSNDMVISYSIPNTSYNYTYVLKLPGDGSKTDTYSVGGTTLVYANSTSTISNGSISFNALNTNVTTVVDSNTTSVYTFGSSGVTQTPRYASTDVRVAVV